MAGYNRIIIIGNLTRDPEHRQLASGQAVCRLGLATNRQFKNRQTGSMVQEVCYVDVEVWGSQADSCRDYLQKGRPVLVEGRLKFDTWEDATAGQRSKHSIVADRVIFLGGAGSEVEAGESTSFVEKTSSVTLNPNNKVEKELMSQLEKAKEKIKAASKPSKSFSKPSMVSDDDSMEVVFKDEPPFEDELPF